MHHTHAPFTSQHQPSSPLSRQEKVTRCAKRAGWAGAALFVSLGLVPLSPAAADPGPASSSAASSSAAPSSTGESAASTSPATPSTAPVSPAPTGPASSSTGEATAPGSTAPSSSAPAAPTPDRSAGPRAKAAPAEKVDKAAVTVYSKATIKLLKTADTKAATVATVVGGSQLQRQATQGTWSKVSYGQAVGWVASSQLGTSNPVVKRNTPAYAVKALSLGQYTNPSGTHFAVPSGSRIVVVGTLGGWERITYNGRTGYVIKGALWRTTPPTVKVKQYSRWVNTKTALRNDTTPSGSLAITLPAGTHGYVVATCGDWSRLNVGTKSSWVLTSQLARSAKSVGVKYNRWVNREMRLTTLPNYFTAGSTVLPVGSYISAVRSSGDWIQVKVAGRTGYLPKSSSLSKRLAVKNVSNTGRFASKSVSVRADTRRSPYAKSVKRISAGTKVQVTGRVGAWARVKIGSTTGYVVESTDLRRENTNSFSVYGTLRSGGVSDAQMRGYSQRDARPRVAQTNLYFWKRMAKAKNDVTVIASGKGSVVQEQYVYSASRGKTMFRKLDGFESYYRISGARVYTAQRKYMTDGSKSWTFYANPKLESTLKRQSKLVRSGDFNDRRRY